LADALRFCYEALMRFFPLASAASFLLAAAGNAQNLLVNGSFDAPVIVGRIPESAGGTPVQAGVQSSWAAFAVSPETSDGRVIAGMTTEVARTGKQSLFVDFVNVTASSRAAVLRTHLIPIKGGHTYRVSLWGRIDRKRPLTLDERGAEVLLEVRYFAADQTSDVGEPVTGTQLIPGEMVPGTTPELIFRSGKWKESFAKASAPEGAAFIRVTWTWATPEKSGETDGVIYWDDAAILDEADAK